jgi:hypothetical protein
VVLFWPWSISVIRSLGRSRSRRGRYPGRGSFWAESKGGLRPRLSMVIRNAFLHLSLNIH